MGVFVKLLEFSFVSIFGSVYVTVATEFEPFAGFVEKHLGEFIIDDGEAPRHVSSKTNPNAKMFGYDK